MLSFWLLREGEILEGERVVGCPDGLPPPPAARTEIDTSTETARTGLGLEIRLLSNLSSLGGQK